MTNHHSIDFGDLRLTVVVSDAPWYQNCFIVQHRPSGAQVVVDPGADPEDIKAAVTANGGTVKEILLTHAHPDHVAAVEPLQRDLGLDCRAHGGETALVGDIEAYAARRLGMRIKAPLSVAYFTGEDDMTLGDTRFRVIETPGHTTGGVCFAFDGFVLTGDTLFAQGVGRTDLPGGDGAVLTASITRLLGMVPPEAILYAGHGPAWSAAEARRWWAQMR